MITANNDIANPCSVCFDALRESAIVGRAQSSLQSPVKNPSQANSSVTLACGHKFHYKCITTWVQTTPRCPLDRRIISSSTPSLNLTVNLLNELFESIENNQVEVVKEILSTALTPELRTSAGARNPLTQALKAGFWEIASELHKAGWTTEDKLAQNNLGFLYQEGIWLAQDYAKALSWFHKSAKQGDDVAAKNLGFMYQSGMGTEQNFTKALFWYYKSACQGNCEAQISLGCMYQHGLGVEQNYDMAVTWYRKAAEQGNVKAQTSLGVMYHKGLGVEQDFAEALFFYRLAANQGSEEAQTNLGFMYQMGLGVERS